MVQAQELRIGNRFIREIKSERGQEFDNDFVLTEEFMKKLFSRVDRDFALNDLYPIVLSPEVLEKCGFKKWGRDDIPRTLSYELERVEIFPANSFCDFEGYGYIHYKPEDFKESAIFKFKYLHQLQNLFYLRTGKELIYKP